MTAPAHPAPPRWARALLAVCLSPADRPYALADLEEEFEGRAAEEGLAAARRWYRWQVARSVGPAVGSRVGRIVRRTGSGPVGGPSRGGGWGMGMQNMWSNAVFAVRTLAKAPTTVAITVVSLGLGIGAVTTVFTVADGLLYPPAPGLRAPEELVTIYTSDEDGDRYGTSSYADFEDVRALGALTDAAVSAVTLASLDDADGGEQLIAEAVSGNFFQVMGIQPLVGRTFLPDEGGSGSGAPVVVLGHDLWANRFASDPGVVGTAIRLNGQPVTVVGVTPEGVVSRRVPVRPDVWFPLGSPPDPGRVERMGRRDAREYLILGRYAQGAGPSELAAQLEGLSARLVDAYPDAWADGPGPSRAFTAVAERASRVNPGARRILGGVAGFFFGITGLILLIACTNVTSLFLVRAARRRQEIALRLALGAKRRQVVALLLTEGLMLGAVAGGVGIVVTHGLTRAMATFSLPVNVPLRLDFHPSGRAYVFAFLTALATALLFSLVPAARVSRSDLLAGLKARLGGLGGGKRRFSPGGVLVSVQLAASLVLLSGAGLFLRSLQASAHMDLGLDPQGVAIMSKKVPDEVGPEGMEVFYREMEERLAAQPGVSHAALSRGVELTLMNLNNDVVLTTPTSDPGEEGVVGFRNAVTPGYFPAMGRSVVRGRGIQQGDGGSATPVAVINQRAAQRLWPGEDALGRTLILTPRGGSPGQALTLQVVGLTEDASYIDVGDPPVPYVWTSLYQDPAPTVAVSLKGTSADEMVRTLRQAVALAPGEAPVLAPSTFEGQLAFQYIHLRLASKVLGWGGVFGLFLALIGVYGLISFSVAERTREIAIRRAVGADAPGVVWAVVRRGTILAATGLALGLAILLPSAHLLRGILLGVSPTDPVALGGGMGLLLGAALLASFIPARRAARIDPMAALRQE